MTNFLIIKNTIPYKIKKNLYFNKQILILKIIIIIKVLILYL